MKKYENPTLEILPIFECDTISASSGIEMPRIESGGGIWDQNIV